MRILYMGTPAFAVPPMEHLIRNRHQVVAVYTQPDREAGRGRRLTVSPVKRVAFSNGLEVVQPETLKDEVVIAQIRKYEPDAIVVAAYGQILPQQVLNIPRLGCINIHPSLLPRYRGASPVPAPILAGDSFTGVTVMLMDAGLDTGPILTQAQMCIAADDTTGSLTGKLSQISARLLEDTLVSWSRGELKPRPQNQEEASYAPILSAVDGKIDWQLSAREIWRNVRAFQPWPGAFTSWQGKRLKIIEAWPVECDETGSPGQVAALTGSTVFGSVCPAAGVVTGGGVLGLLKVQMEGKQAIPVTDFLRGRPDFIGSLLPC